MAVSGISFRFVLLLLGGAFVWVPGSVSGATRTWDGGGTTASWSNPNNWTDDIGPNSNDDLVFPSTTLRVSNDNDFLPSTLFRSILISGYNYTLSGNRITLTHGLTNIGPYNSIVRLPVWLGADQTFMVHTGFVSQSFQGSVIDLNGYDLTLAGPGAYLVSSIIQGPGNLIMRARSLTLSATNTYTGTTYVFAGTVVAESSRAFGDASAGTQIGGGTTLFLRGGTPFDEPFAFAGGAISVQNADLTLNGAITLTGTNVNFLGSHGATINGVMSGAGGISQDWLGSGALILNANNTYIGSNYIKRGTFVVNGQQPGSDVFLKEAGILGGSGQVGRILSTGGRIAPGGNDRAILSCTGLIFDQSTSLVLDVGGVIAAEDHDQLRVFGSIMLGDASLIFSNSFAPAGGEQLVIVDNDGADPIGGTFDGFFEGEILAIGGARFRISYVGGDGNDVVLTALSPPPPATGVVRLWDGGGADNLWSTVENWQGDVPPGVGDDLEFPAGSAQLENVNDYPGTTSFNALRLTGWGYRLIGGRIALNGGIFATHPSGINEVAMPLDLNTNQTFRSTGAPLHISGTVQTAGSTLTIDHEGQVVIGGVISGSGGIWKAHSGRLSLLGANTYSGGTEVVGGELIVSNAMALGSAAGGTLIRSNATLTIYSDLPTEGLTLEGRLRSVGESPSSSNIINAPITLPFVNAAQLQVSNVLVMDSFDGTGSFRKLGEGTLVLNGTTDYRSASYVSNGTVIVNGSVNTDLIVINGLIGGTGWLARVTAPESPLSTNRTISPGLGQPGIMTLDEMVIQKNTFVGAGTRVVIQLNGTEPGIGYDQLRIEDFAYLNNARLEISVGFTPVRGDRFVIVEVPYGVNGRFAGMRQGTAFMVGETQFQISYRGGDGNDIELRVTRGLSLSRFWDGGGTNSYWSNPQNWMDDVVPAHNDTVVFPNSLALRTLNTNDLPAGTEFTFLIVDGRFQIYGAPIALDVGFIGYETATIGVPITLLTNLTFICDKDVYAPSPIVEFRGGIDLAGHELLISNTAPIRVRGQLGAGKLLKAQSGTVELYTNNLLQQVQVLDGELAVYHSNALGSLDVPVEVAEGAQLTVAGNGAVWNPLLLSGTLAAAGAFSNQYAGSISMQSPSVSISAAATFLISGAIQGDSDLIKVGSGRLLLMADNTYTGSTILSNGTLHINGSQLQSPVVVRSGTLGGIGFAGNITSSGTISPGRGTSSLLQDIGIFNSLNLTAAPNSVLGFTINGSTPGVQYDQLNVTGTVAINGSRLSSISSMMRFAPAVSESFVLIANDASDPVLGTFLGVPEGARFVHSNMLFQITYGGGDGNDVVLTRLAAPPANVRSFTVQGQSLLITGAGISNLVYTIESATNLMAPVAWEVIGTSVADRFNSFEYIHTNGLSEATRFYRVASP